MNTNWGDSSAPGSPRKVVYLGQDDELYAAIDAYARSMEWTTMRVPDANALVSVCKRGEVAACLVEGALDDFDTIAALVTLQALKKRPRVVAYIDEIDGPTVSVAKRSFGIDEIFVKPCDLTTLATCLMDASPRHSLSRLAAGVESSAVTQAMGGGA